MERAEKTEDSLAKTPGFLHSPGWRLLPKPSKFIDTKENGHFRHLFLTGLSLWFPCTLW